MYYYPPFSFSFYLSIMNDGFMVIWLLQDIVALNNPGAWVLLLFFLAYCGFFVFCGWVWRHYIYWYIHVFMAKNGNCQTLLLEMIQSRMI